MLVIAVPKSASSSLLKTLGLLHNVPANNDLTLKDKYPSKYFRRGYMHGDHCELNHELVDKFINRNEFWRQHILPTPNNLEILKNHKKVILLRDPKSVVLGYKRAFDNKTSEHTVADTLPKLVDCKTDEDWLMKAEETGFLEDVQEFCGRWENADGEQLIIYYRDLIKNPQTTINAIEEYFNLGISKNVALAKERYTRSPVRNFLRKTRIPGLLNGLLKSYRLTARNSIVGLLRFVRLYEFTRNVYHSLKSK